MMTMPVGLASRAVRGPAPASSLRGELYGRPLSPREMECLLLYAQLGQASDVAHELNVSLQTVRSHHSNAYAKLGVTNVLEAIGALGWLHVPDVT